MNHRYLPLAMVASLLPSGCASLPSAAARLQSANAVAALQGWQARTLPTSTFELQAWVPPAAGKATDTLTVYVEGDGLAWINSGTPSDDPTPTRPLVLRMAMAQPGGGAAYLGRPCQYTRTWDARCATPWWTEKRFAEDVIAAMDQGLDALKRERGATHIVLVGYSGGGAVTALLAERRNDITGWITVAGNIDTQAWARHHRISPLAGSLDPMAASARLRGLPQWHFTGSRDAVVPPALTRAFASQMPVARVIEREGYDHQCCWADDWAKAYPLKQ